MQTIHAALCCSACPLSKRRCMLWQLNEHNIHFLLAFLYSKGYFLLYVFGKEEDENSSLVGLVGFIVISIKYLVNGWLSKWADEWIWAYPRMPQWPGISVKIHAQFWEGSECCPQSLFSLLGVFHEPFLCVCVLYKSKSGKGYGSLGLLAQCL